MLVIISISLIVVYLVVNVVAVLVRNYKAHKFFQTKAPQLPALPRPNIFTGHLDVVLTPDKNWRIVDEMHKKYGPSFGFYMIEQPWLSTMDLDLIKLVELDEAQKHLGRAIMGFPFEDFNHSIVQVNGTKWRQVRRIFTPAFTNHKVRSDEVSSDIDSVVGQLAAAMERRANKALKATGGKSSSFVVDAKDMLDRYALAVIFLITYKQADLIDFDADQDVWVNNIDTASRGIPNPVIHASMMFPFTRPLCKFLAQFHIVGKIQLEIVDYIVKATDINRVAREQHAKLQKKLSLSEPGSKERSFSEVKSTGIFKRRLVDTIIDAFLDKRIHYDNFIGSLLFLMLAGFKTTSDTIAALVWRLAKNPDIQERLRNTLWKEGIDADYVVWCINETVRLHPAVPLAAGRILGEDVELNGQFYAKGIHIMPATYSIHRDPKIWPEPERFNPDRWRDQANFHPAAFMGFGLGPRNCLGGKLAVHETKLVIRMILNNYKLEVCDKTPDEWRFSSPGLFFTLNDEPINIRFSPLAKSENSNNAA